MSRALEFFRYFASGFLKFLDALPQAFGQFRKLPRAKQHKHDRQDQYDFPSTDSKCSKHNIHILAFVQKKLIDSQGSVKPQSSGILALFQAPIQAMSLQSFALIAGC